jgi:hypothetical protein
MISRPRLTLAGLLALLLSAAPGSEAAAQPLGLFHWQLSPFCNVITVSVTQNGALYTLDGHDNQCGGPQQASVVGTGFTNPDGTIGLGLNLVVAPGGTPVHVDATIDIVSLSGTWRDSTGASGAFVFSARPPASGSPRPIPTPAAGDITEVAAGQGLSGGGASGNVTLAADLAAVQARVTGTCAAGQAIRQIQGDGTVLCESGGGAGDITAVVAGTGLLGGGTSGPVALSVAFAGPGLAATSARSDHDHEGATGTSNTAVGPDALTNERALFGEGHPSVLATSRSLASVIEAQGRYGEARRLREDDRARAIEVLGEHDVFVAIGLNGLGQNGLDSGRPDLAVTDFRRALEVRRQIHPADHWRIAEARGRIGTALLAAGRLAEAEPDLVAAYEGLNIQRGTGADETERVRLRLLELYERLHRPDDARRYRVDDR